MAAVAGRSTRSLVIMEASAKICAIVTIAIALSGCTLETPEISSGEVSVFFGWSSRERAAAEPRTDCAPEFLDQEPSLWLESRHSYVRATRPCQAQRSRRFLVDAERVAEPHRCKRRWNTAHSGIFVGPNGNVAIVAGSEAMMPNNAFERTVAHRGPRLAAARSSRPAAQLDR